MHMATYRKVNEIIASKQVMEGAGVKLNRVFGYYEVPLFDPFLLLDHFKSKNPDDFMSGFPWHPHRGIETVTYMIAGQVQHGDSLGNKGVIESGDVQWMTAGSGIIHEEMPINDNTGIEGFQLWVNLSAENKMISPRYQEIKKEEIPELKLSSGIKVKVICGKIDGIAGPVKGIAARPNFLDVQIPAGGTFEYPVKKQHNISAYIFEGIAYLEDDVDVEKFNAVIFGEGDMVRIRAKDKVVRLLLIAGLPLKEKIAWNGPIVMNTEGELKTAFNEFRNGTFIKT